MRILIATDAWPPQINGVVVALANVIAGLRRLGHEVHVVSPEGMRTIPTPGYPEIPLAVFPGREVARRIEAARPDAIHIATEGPIGHAARGYCVKRGLRFTSAYHTCFPEYISLRTGLPLAWTYAVMRRFHAASDAVLVATDTMRATLARWGFERLLECPLGVDLELFRPSSERFEDLPRPVFTYVGRLAVEKDLPAFLELDLPGTKLVVGDGPARAKLQRRHPEARFVGFKTGAELASHYQRSDAFVFPSRTETFGLVMLEAMACGVPVAALPVRGPLDVVKDPATGVLDWDLRRAALAALDLDRADARRYAERFPWQATIDRFAAHLVPAAAARSSSTGPLMGTAAD
ncbi:MAG TPA: glycosyltransferase family 1 protein [Usitatibacter sp.]|jgi:glycosyltransferase involved in cell wall biosynthesis|nr:glycosyltransferase family 1 protein [Usitatibacter sp.]